MTSVSDLDPRTKLILIMCLTSAAVLISNWIFLSGLCLVSFGLLSCFGVSLWSIIKRIRLLLYMMIVIALLQSVFAPAGPDPAGCWQRKIGNCRRTSQGCRVSLANVDHHYLGRHFDNIQSPGDHTGSGAMETAL